MHSAPHQQRGAARRQSFRLTENAAASTPDVASWWMQVSTGWRGNGEGGTGTSGSAAWRAVSPLLQGEVTEPLQLHG
jgi:hypothetical protein